MKTRIIFFFLLAALSCSRTALQPLDEIALAPVYPAASKVSDNGFEQGDMIGVFITRYESDVPSVLQIGGNWGNNLSLICQGASWVLLPRVWWADGKFDIYAYYPKSDVTSIEDHKFSVSTDQSLPSGPEAVDSYAASDFLWAKAEGVSRTETVPLYFRHKMSKVEVFLHKGEEYEGDIPVDAQVFIHSTVTAAIINLSTGDVVRDQTAGARSIKARKLSATHFDAIVVPQRISGRLPIVEIVAGQVSYLFETSILFKSGMTHAIHITLNDNPDKTAIDIGGQIDNWN